MPLNKRFLVVDDNADARSLLTRTLLRKFPQSLITECGDATTAVLTARSEKLDAIVVHRAGEITGLELVSMLRKIAPHLPVVYVSGIDRSVEAQEAGASAFLNYDAWLGLGTLVAGVGHELNNPLSAITLNLEILSDLVMKNLKTVVQIKELLGPAAEQNPALLDALTRLSPEHTRVGRIFEDVSAATDLVFEDQGVKVFVDPDSLPLINGTTVDFVKQGLNEAFRFHNPNIKGECGCGESFNV